jgi:DNA-binding HxlR family transcriptional regulator
MGRALRPISPEDSRWFAVVLRGEFSLQGVGNRDLQRELLPQPESDPARRHQCAAHVTRQLRLLRAHGLIYRVNQTYYYRPTQKGYAVMSAALKLRHTNLASMAA